MSSLEQLFGGGGGGMIGAPQAEAPPAPEGVTPPGADGANPEDVIEEMLERLTSEVIPNETDAQGRAELTKIAQAMATYVANQEKLVDTATGAGPGARVLRRVGAGGGP